MRRAPGGLAAGVAGGGAAGLLEPWSSGRCGRAVQGAVRRSTRRMRAQAICSTSATSPSVSGGSGWNPSSPSVLGEHAVERKRVQRRSVDPVSGLG